MECLESSDYAGTRELIETLALSFQMCNQTLNGKNLLKKETIDAFTPLNIPLLVKERKLFVQFDDHENLIKNSRYGNEDSLIIG